MNLQQYIENLNQRYQLGNATEHTFRGDLQQLLETLVPNIQATNEPKRQACGAPDYILTKKDIPIGFIEAKDIGDQDLDGLKKSGNKAQFDRYKASLENLIFTDYINFHLYREGELVMEISIGKLTPEGIVPMPEHFANFERFIKDFCLYVGQTIKSSKKLAAMMASKAQLLAEVIEKAINSDEQNQENSTLKEQMTAFRQILIHDITPKGFADVYAQTIAYGMFAARLHDPTLNTFSRQKAAELIPHSNPFLRKLFQYIAGYDLDARIRWILDDLVQIFLACNIEEILQNYGKATSTEDPIIHFYETFLSEYDPKLRKSRGVWYTPQPVVRFMVEAVDALLKTEFELPQGLADTTKTNINIDLDGKKVLREVHKVQILDPATGTVTFLAEVIRQIRQKFQGREGIWNNYVENDLMPRLNGFELLMASYAMAHLKLELLLKETGYKTPSLSIGGQQRFRIFLTNSLEESHPDSRTLFATWLSAEANEASYLKRDTPVMCVIGNPPYSVSSTNKGNWIDALTADYKKGLKERNIQPLSDDYIKFIRYGQYFIEKNGSGIVAYISNNSFLDGLIHRQMRKELLECFDKIYVLNLHGSSKKSETSPDGSKDENVFDIQQGVSINIFLKIGKQKDKELAQVFHVDLYGKREDKYSFLEEKTLNTIQWKMLKPEKPYFFFVEKDFSGQEEYEKGFKISELMPISSTGIKTHRDNFVVDIEKDALQKRIKFFLDKEYTDQEVRYKFSLKDNRDWKLSKAREGTRFSSEKLRTVLYRPFDIRYIYYDAALIDFSKYNVMQHMEKENISLLTCRQQSTFDFQHILISNILSDMCTVSLQTKETTYAFPLYLYPPKPKSPVFSSKREQQKQELLYRLKQAKEHYKQVKQFFEATVLPFYEAIENPSIENHKLFEENKTQYEEAKTTVESLQEQLEEIQKEEQQQPEPLSEMRVPNLNRVIIEKIAEDLDLHFTQEKEDTTRTFAPIDLLDYMYAVLHAPSYRQKYQTFLKIDFPRVPYPKNQENFWQLVKLGGELRQVHLLESPQLENSPAKYPESGDNLISNITHQGNRVYINEKQYFSDIPKTLWEFYVGGYQPAQKWLKDRKDYTLDSEEIKHYQKIISALSETIRLMQEIDKMMMK